MNGEAPRAGVREAVAKATNSVHPLHWWQAFPQVRAKGGFDVLLGNPPWERIKLQEEEFFASRSEQIATAPHKSERGRLIAELGEAEDGSSERRLYDEFIAARRVAEAASLYAHDSGRYPLTGVGDVNTYALFAESFAQLMAEKGRAGFIVPTGIATDDSTKAYFESISQSGRLVSLLAFENEEFVFPAVHHSFRFCLITLGSSQRTEFVFFARQSPQIHDKRRRFALTPEEFRLINPNTRTCPLFRTQQDAELTKKLYRAAPVLVEEGTREKNSWGIRFMTMMHMSSDSGLFVTEPGSGRLPLYEAKMIEQYDHRSGSYEHRGDERGFRVLPPTPITAYQNPDYSVTPYYWIEEKEVQARLADKWDRPWFIGFKDVTSAVAYRTFILSVIPYSGVGHTMPLILPRTSNISAVACLLANCNSLIADYVARQKIGYIHMTYGYVKQLPISPPSKYTEADIAFIVPRVLELTYTAHDLKSWANDLGYDGTPFVFDPERRALLRDELDAFFARLYGLTRDELRYILDPAEVMGADYPSETFRVQKNIEMREFGEYRTRDLVLREFDRMALADAAGEPYQSLLVPPPGQLSSPQYSSIGVIRDADDARWVGLVLALIRQPGSLPRQRLTLALAAAQIGSPADTLPPAEAAQLAAYRQSHAAMLSAQPERLPSILRFFETAGAIRFQQQGLLIEAIPDASMPSGVIVEPGIDAIAGILLRLAGAAQERQAADEPSTALQPASKRA